MGSGRNYYAVKSMTLTDTQVKIFIQKKEKS